MDMTIQEYLDFVRHLLEQMDTDDQFLTEVENNDPNSRQT